MIKTVMWINCCALFQKWCFKEQYVLFLVLEGCYKSVSLCRLVCKNLVKTGKRLNILVDICFKGRTGEAECLGSSAELGEHVWYWGDTDEGLWESRSIQWASESLPASVWHLCQFGEVQGKTVQADPWHVSHSGMPVNCKCWLCKLPAIRCWACPVLNWS